jgi:hypothetical protein
VSRTPDQIWNMLVSSVRVSYACSGAGDLGTMHNQTDAI